VDLYLIHWPFGVKYKSDYEFEPVDQHGIIEIDLATSLEAVWKAMESQVESGRAKAIGVANFSVPQIERILKIAQIPVANVQVELHAYFPQKEFIGFCSQKGITVTAYTPLGSPWKKKLSGES